MTVTLLHLDLSTIFKLITTIIRSTTRIALAVRTMSLAFLSKKSWHTTNVKNVEKVWIAEQKAEAEAKALAELQKQLTEERQLQELRQLQAQHGHVSKEVDNSLDWMYQGPSAQTQHRESAEEYLLGKVYSGKSSAAIKESLQPQVLASKLWLYLEKLVY